MRYFLYLAYHGGAYSGWQTQPNAPTVQETIEQALHTILQKPCPILGAGRTDAGVHARSMVAHLDLALNLEEANHLLDRLNRLLPPDIVLHRIVAVRDDAHARFSATYRTYRYYVDFKKDPFNSGQTLRLYQPLDIVAMNEAAHTLLEYTDFTSFSKLHTDVKTNNCKVSYAHWEESPSGKYVFTIRADRFLRNMVRAIVGTLFLVGKGRMTIEEFRAVIERKDRSAAGSSAPGYALFLEEVGYPEDLFVVD